MTKSWKGLGEMFAVNSCPDTKGANPITLLTITKNPAFLSDS
jgi:hypothetical protein